MVVLHEALQKNWHRQSMHKPCRQTSSASNGKPIGETPALLAVIKKRSVHVLIYQVSIDIELLATNQCCVDCYEDAVSSMGNESHRRPEPSRNMHAHGTAMQDQTASVSWQAPIGGFLQTSAIMRDACQPVSHA
eukprot:5149625-Amphidinium_carterae.1